MKRFALIGLSLLIASPATAQDDWDLGRDPERKLTIAAVTYDNFGVAVRCMDDVMSVVVSGLPPGRGIRSIRHQIGDQPEATGRWVSAGEGAVAFSVWPASTAAYLSGGGRWVLEVPDGDRLRRISVDLPASTSAIGAVFTACGRTLSPTSQDDEPSQDSFAGLRWSSMPTPEYPDRTNAGGGLAALTCTVGARGNLRACRIESEFPDGAGFGRAAVAAAHRRGRVEPVDPGTTRTMEGLTVAYTARFNLIDDFREPLPPIATRLPLRTD